MKHVFLFKFHFIYTLDFDGVVYYVGLTTNAPQRYYEHFINSCSRAAKYNRYSFLINGKLPNMTLHSIHTNINLARQAEYTLIRKMDENFTLLNHTNNVIETNKGLPQLKFNNRILRDCIREYLDTLNEQQIKLINEYAKTKKFRFLD